MKLLVLVFLFSVNVFANHDACIVRRSSPKYLNLAFAQFTPNYVVKKSPWPFQLLSIGHNMASYQYYGGGLDQAYFHHGLDIRSLEAEKVYASRGGKVVNFENYVRGNRLYWEIAILDNEGYLWQYHHIDRNSIPSEIENAYKNGSSIADGTFLGEIVYWPVVSFGERYHHLHLNVLDGNKNFVNPFHFLEPLDDKSVPEILEIGIIKNKKIVTNNKVSGTYKLYAKVSDFTLHNKFILPPYEIKIKVDNQEEQIVWKFDQLPGGSSIENFANDFYFPDQTCGDYNCREIFINLNFSKLSSQAISYGKGNHQILVTIADFAGNRSSKIYQWIEEMGSR